MHTVHTYMIATSVLAVVSRVPTGTATVSIGRWMLVCSSILTGCSTVCKYETYVHSYVHKCMLHGPTTSMLHGCMCRKHTSVLAVARIPCTHWDSDSKYRKINHSMFPHSGRWDYRLQSMPITVYESITTCCAIAKAGNTLNAMHIVLYPHFVNVYIRIYIYTVFT